MTIEERIRKTIEVLKHVQPANYDSMVCLVASVNELESVLKDGKELWKK